MTSSDKIGPMKTVLGPYWPQMLHILLVFMKSDPPGNTAVLNLLFAVRLRGVAVWLLSLWVWAAALRRGPGALPGPGLRLAAPPGYAQGGGATPPVTPLQVGPAG